MNKTELVARLASASSLSKADARRVIEALFDPRHGIIVAALKSGGAVNIPGFGAFRLHARRARVGRNPSSGAAITIPASRSVKFQTAKHLREPVPGGKTRTRRPGKRPQQRTGAKASPESGAAEVAFTAYHPREVRLGTWYNLLAYAHLPGALTEVEQDSRARLRSEAAGYAKGKGAETAVIRRGAEITVIPSLPGCRFNPARASFDWLRDWHCAQFELQAAAEEPGYEQGSAVNGSVSFYIGPILVGQVKIWAHLAEEGSDAARKEPETESESSKAFRAIFVSYAHEDTEIVKGLERAYKALGDTYLRDVETLRAGEKWNRALLKMIEKADVFQLCWSRAAKQSRFVEQEWRHALAQEREDPFIRPTYWETPMPDPPRELQDIHFAPLGLD